MLPRQIVILIRTFETGCRCIRKETFELFRSLDTKFKKGVGGVGQGVDAPQILTSGRCGATTTKLRAFKLIHATFSTTTEQQQDCEDLHISLVRRRFVICVPLALVRNLFVSIVLLFPTRKIAFFNVVATAGIRPGTPCLEPGSSPLESIFTPSFVATIQPPLNGLVLILHKI